MNRTEEIDSERKAKHAVAESLYKIERAAKHLSETHASPDALMTLNTELEHLRAALLKLKVIQPGF